MDASMMASCTKMIEIQEEYDIERKATLIEPLRDEEEFNEIDAILGEEVPKL